MNSTGDDKQYDAVVAVHGFNPLAPEDPDTKDFDTVAQDRLREAYNEVQRQEEYDKDVLLAITGGPYQERLDEHLTEDGHDSVEDYDLPSEAELMLTQLEWMYTGHGEDEEGRLGADETGLNNEHGEYNGVLDDIDADIVLESESQNTEENIDYLQNIVEESGASELYAATSRDHAPRAGYGNVESIEDETEAKVRPVSSKLSYAAPETDEDGDITELNPGVFFGEKAKLKPVIDALEDNIWGLFGDSRDDIDEKAEEVGKVLNR